MTATDYPQAPPRYNMSRSPRLEQVQRLIAACYDLDYLTSPDPIEWMSVMGRVQEFVQEGDRALVIGSGIGLIPAYVSTQLGAFTHTLDRYSQITGRVESEFALTVHEGDVERQSFYDLRDQFKAVILTSLDHFNFNPLRALAVIRGVLCGGGRLYVVTPNAVVAGRRSRYRSFEDLPWFDPIDGEYDDPAWTDEVGWTYTSEELVQVSEEAGYQPKAVEGRSGMLVAELALDV